MKLTYIYQSSFLLECESVIFIFDYYRANVTIHKEILDIVNNTSKKIFILVSHSHYDHFNEEIFDWKNKNLPITYILSDEVKSAKPNIANLDVVFLDKYTSFNNEEYNIKVNTYGSTDIGCSFHISVDEKEIFHAGDLNNWHWNEEASPEDIKKSEDYYLSELAIIAKDISKIDYLFYPIDERLGKDYLRGIEQFLNVIEVKLLTPMHFGTHYPKYSEIQEKLSKINPNLQIVKIDKAGYSIKI